MSPPHSILFVYWGRRGLSRFTLDLVKAAHAHPDVTCVLSLSRQNQDFDLFAQADISIDPIDTFAHGSGALLKAWHIPLIRRQLVETIKNHRIDTVITLMPHLWTTLVMPVLKPLGVNHYVMIHDGIRHPGDISGLAHRLLLLAGKQADAIITLSDSVKQILCEREGITADLITTLFHPLMPLKAGLKARPFENNTPWRLLFLGRIQAYKGLGLLIKSVALLQQKGFPVHLTVMGEGSLDNEQEGLQQIGATITNRWLSETDIVEAIATHHVMMLSHIEASQSGVAALALGNAMPVIATPVGGLTEQIIHGQTGLITREVSAEALAEQIIALFTQENLLNTITHQLVEDGARQSYAQLVEGLLQMITQKRQSEFNVV
jgi:glycosyltransferase involved in cell wall biosynthesis